MREVFGTALLGFIVLLIAVFLTLIYAKLHAMVKRVLYRHKIKYLMRLGYTPIEAVCIASQPYGGE